jgi:hypothetical protein
MRLEAGSFSLMNSADIPTGIASSALWDVARPFPSLATESRSRSVYSSSTGREVKGCAAVEGDGIKGQGRFYGTDGLQESLPLASRRQTQGQT